MDSRFKVGEFTYILQRTENNLKTNFELKTTSMHSKLFEMYNRYTSVSINTADTQFELYNLIRYCTMVRSST